MILMAYRHGLRVSELIGLRWSQVDFTTARLTVTRVKGSTNSTHGIPGDELRELRKLQRSQIPGTRFLFMSELGTQMTVVGFRKMLDRTGELAGIPQVHPHMLRHSCGFALADRGKDLREIQDYLGHKNIQNTVGYTRLRPGRFDNIWENGK
jgi:integrase